jgi:hypothetical protein
MSEKIYALLLRLYPAHFRKAYAEEALQLFRDRARDESGFFPILRLWIDVLADLAFTVPREYFYFQRALVAASAPQHLDGTPSFFILENDSPRLGALLFGAVFSLAAVATISVLIGHGGSYRPLGTWAARTPLASGAHSSAHARTAPKPAGDSEDKTIAPGQQSEGASLAPGDAELNSFQSNLAVQSRGNGIPQPQAQLPKTQDAASAMIRTADDDMKLDTAERQRVIERTIGNLKKYYVDTDVAQKTADALLAHEKSGEDDTATDGGAFADLLTRQMRDVSHDMHLELVYSKAPLPQHPAEPTPEDLARYRKSMEQQECMFEKVEILPRNIGYLKLNFFADTSVCQSTATAAMASLNHADAIIFDLRDNTGGFPSMVALIAGYLFDHPEYLYNPREAPTPQSWTQSPVPGNRLADKPVYVLTSARTTSGAEQFCYNLKMLKRATLVGETTHGSAHAGVWHRIDDHFGMGITEAKTINPYSKTDWEGTGVEPDIKVKAADALEAAKKLAQRKLQKK